jgi:hypothetical protein
MSKGQQKYFHFAWKLIAILRNLLDIQKNVNFINKFKRKCILREAICTT